MSKQAILPLWGSAANARQVTLAAARRFDELCVFFVDADDTRDASRAGDLLDEMHALVASINRFRLSQSRKWANEREAQRR